MPRYIKLHVQLLDNPKVQEQLPSDAARWHYVQLLLHGKGASPEGQWLNRDYLRRAVGDATFGYLEAFMATAPEGLVIEDPDGRIRIRQWWKWQASDLHARQEELSEAQREKKRARWRRNKAEERARKQVRDRDGRKMSETATFTRGPAPFVPEPAATDPAPSAGERCNDCHQPFTPRDIEKGNFHRASADLTDGHRLIARAGAPFHETCP